MTQPTTDPEYLEGQFRAAQNELGRIVDSDIPDAWRKLVNQVNATLHSTTFQAIGWLSPLAGYALYDKIDEAMDRLDKVVTEARTKIQEIVDRSLPIVSLYRTALDWTNDVQAPMSALSGVAVDRHDNLYAWTGPAASAYTAKVLLQKTAIEATGQRAKEIGDWLTKLAELNLQFLLALLTPVKDIFTSLVSAGIAAISVAGVLEAIGKCADLVGKMLTIIIDVVKATVINVAGTVSAIVTADGILNNHNAYPDKHWPQVVYG